MAKKKNEDVELIKIISNIRTRNNTLWMKILSLAIEAAPVKTKTILADINENDRRISKLFTQLSER